MTKKEHASEDIDSDLIAFMAENKSENNYHKVWVVESRNDKNSKYERIIADQAEEHQHHLNNIPNILQQ